MPAKVAIRVELVDERLNRLRVETSDEVMYAATSTTEGLLENAIRVAFL